MRVKDRRRRALPVPDERRGSMHDRREHERVLVSFEVDYRCDDTFLFAYITDLSAMGIFVQTPNPHAPGTQLNLSFKPPGGGVPIDVEGRVIWVNRPRPDSPESRNPGMGVQFLDLTPAQREQIMGLIRTFAYLPDDDDDRILGNS
jgi:type IV pilus assembly protein PilZ